MGIFYQSGDDGAENGGSEPLKQTLILDGVELKGTVGDLLNVLSVAQTVEGKLGDFANQLLQIMGDDGSLGEAIEEYKKSR